MMSGRSSARELLLLSSDKRRGRAPSARLPSPPPALASCLASAAPLRPSSPSPLFSRLPSSLLFSLRHPLNEPAIDSTHVLIDLPAFFPLQFSPSSAFRLQIFASNLLSTETPASLVRLPVSSACRVSLDWTSVPSSLSLSNSVFASRSRLLLSRLACDPRCSDQPSARMSPSCNRC